MYELKEFMKLVERRSPRAFGLLFAQPVARCTACWEVLSTLKEDLLLQSYAKTAYFALRSELKPGGSPGEHLLGFCREYVSVKTGGKAVEEMSPEDLFRSMQALKVDAATNVLLENQRLHTALDEVYIRLRLCTGPQ